MTVSPLPDLFESVVAAALSRLEEEHEVLESLPGSSFVYRVRHRALGQARIAKILPPASTPGAERRSRRRLRLLRRARSSSLPRIYDLLELEDGGTVLILEPLPGPTLRQWLKEEGRLSWPQTLDLGRHLLAALDELHRGGVVHRAIAPEHLILSVGENGGIEGLHLVGLGRFDSPREETLPSTTTLADLSAEARYRAPEELDPRVPRRRRLEPRVDLYCAGLVLAEAMSGRFPLPCDDLASLVAAHCGGKPPALSEIAPEVEAPAGFESFLHRALSKNPARRFRDAAEMARALEAVARGERAASAAGARAERRRFSPGLVVGLLLLVSLAGLVLVSAFRENRGADRPAPTLQLEATAVLPAPEERIGSIPTLFGVAVDSEGNLYLGSEARDRIYKLSPQGETLGVWGEEGNVPGRFDQPAAIVVDDEGRLYVVDSHNHRIQKLDPEGSVVAVFGGPGVGRGTFEYPFDLALGPAGDELYVVDQGNDLIQVLDLDGRFLRQWGGPGNADGGFGRPWGISVTEDRVLVSDNATQSVSVFTLDGAFLESWPTDLPGVDVRAPRGLAVDREGRVFLASNAGFHAFDLRGRHLGRYRPPEDDPLPVPMDVVLTPSGDLWVTDNVHPHVVRLRVSEQDGTPRSTADDSSRAPGAFVREPVPPELALADRRSRLTASPGTSVP